jgi:hypothetical protein
MKPGVSEKKLSKESETDGEQPRGSSRNDGKAVGEAEDGHKEIQVY